LRLGKQPLLGIGQRRWPRIVVVVVDVGSDTTPPQATRNKIQSLSHTSPQKTIIFIVGVVGCNSL
jgi:hypothetical protein